MEVKVKISKGKLIVEVEDLPLIPERVELHGKDEYATYFLDGAWTGVIKDVDTVKVRLAQFDLDDLVDKLTEFGFDRFQLNVKNYAVMYEIMITAIRNKRGDLAEISKINEKIKRHEFCEVIHFETYKDETQITVACEAKTV